MVLVFVVVLVLSSFCVPLPSGQNPINCGTIASNSNGYTNAMAEIDCNKIDYCFWNVADGTCKKDDCLEALDDFDGNQCTTSTSDCKKVKYNTTSTCTDATEGGTASYTVKSQAYCSRKQTLNVDNAGVLACHYEFVKSGGTCGGDCQLIPFNQTASGFGQITTSVCFAKPGPCENLGTQSCHTDPSCVVLGDQCVEDICAGLTTYNSDTKVDGECTQVTPINWRIICKEYSRYTFTGRGGGSGDNAYKIKKDLICGSRFGKYYGSYNTPDPCVLLPTKYLWQLADTGSRDHGCKDPDYSKCVQAQCNSDDAPLNCTTASGIDGVVCKVVGDKCTDGREAVYTPPDEGCSSGSTLVLPSGLVMFVLAALVAILFD